jgi:serine phosphatase RsbU (regulator of sigma subunit)
LPVLLNDNKEMCGYEKVIEELKSATEKSPNGIINYLTASVEKLLKGKDLDDDLTFVIIKAK